MWNEVQRWWLRTWHTYRARAWSKKLIAVRADQVDMALKNSGDFQPIGTMRDYKGVEKWSELHAGEMTALGAIHYHQSKAKDAGWTGAQQ